MKKQKFIDNISPIFKYGICHRGLHTEEFTENGMNAFLNAKNHNMAIELDVHLTTDNELIVCHDSDLIRTTGKPGIIEEMTSKEIKENYRLRDGEEISTLREVMDKINEEVPIVIELKVWQKNYKALAKRVQKEIANVKDKKNYILISFDPRALTPFKHSGFMRQLLLVAEGKYTALYPLRHHFEAIDIDFHALGKKKVIKYYQNHYVNAWTILSVEELMAAKDHCDVVTFQNIDPELVKETMSKKR